MNRRKFLKDSTLLTTGVFGFWQDLIAQAENSRFKIGACDWSIGQRGKLAAFDVAQMLGLDGLQVSYKVQDTEEWLQKPGVQNDYSKKVKSSGVAIGSLALGLLNQFPYKSDPRTEQWVLDSIETAKNLHVKVILLAFFGKGDLKNDPDGKKEVIRRLKMATPKAEKAGIILGIESWLSASEHVELIDAVESPNLKVYYDVANSHKMGYDIYEEIRWLGKERICEFHAKENGFLLGKGKIDFMEVRKAIDDIGYQGWIQMEGALPKDADLMESYHENTRVMREVFQE